MSFDRQATDEGRNPAPRAARARAWIALLAALTALATACASEPEPVEACLVLEASENLNLYEGEPHPITVYVFPLSSPSGFEQSTVEDLLSERLAMGMLEGPTPITVSPGEARLLREIYPPETHRLGMVADYYRAPGDPAGTRTLIVRAECGWLLKTKVVLSPRDIYPK